MCNLCLRQTCNLLHASVGLLAVYLHGVSVVLRTLHLAMWIALRKKGDTLHQAYNAGFDHFLGPHRWVFSFKFCIGLVLLPI
jgi:NADH:ubiquinone oxidoreductase subunit 3 (subunit A)